MNRRAFLRVASALPLFGLSVSVLANKISAHDIAGWREISDSGGDPNYYRGSVCVPTHWTPARGLTQNDFVMVAADPVAEGWA